MILSKENPFLTYIVMEKEGYVPTNADQIFGALIADAYNLALKNCGFPFRIGEQGIAAKEGGFEDTAPLSGAILQVLRVLTAILMNHGGLTMIEHPETGLHPKWQACMGELLFRAMNNTLFEEEAL